MPTQGTPSPEQLHILLARAQRDGLDATILERLTVILRFAENRYSISETCRQFDISRSTFHRWMERFDPNDLTTLADKSHEPQSYRSSAIDQETIELIRRYRMRYLQMGKERIAELLTSEYGVSISSSSVGRVIERQCFYFADTPLHWKKRMEHGVHAQTVSVQEDDVDVAEQLESVVPVHQHIHITEEKPATTAKSMRASWSGLKRFIIVSCVITNVAFVSILLGMALFENVDVPQMHDMETLQSFHAAPSTRTQP